MSEHERAASTEAWPLWKQQLNLFLLALGFFSRIPIPAWVVYSSSALNQANRYFSSVGWFLGGLVGLSLWCFSMWFPLPVAVLLAMLVSVLLTGVFHEDGLADTADGFGGAFARNDKLRIMKDSRLGTYGATALFFALGAKWLFLSQLGQNETQSLVSPVIAILVAYPVSRAFAASFIFSLPYVTDETATEATSKSKPLAMQQTSTELLIVLLACLPIVLLIPVGLVIALLFMLCILRVLLARFYLRQIGGYTGDCLGAAQQVAELSCYLLFLV